MTGLIANLEASRLGRWKKEISVEKDCSQPTNRRSMELIRRQSAFLENSSVWWIDGRQIIWWESGKVSCFVFYLHLLWLQVIKAKKNSIVLTIKNHNTSGWTLWGYSCHPLWTQSDIWGETWDWGAERLLSENQQWRTSLKDEVWGWGAKRLE